MSEYTPPLGNVANFDLKTFTPPLGNAVNFELVIISEVSHLYIYKNSSWQKIFPKTYHNGVFNLRITRVYYLNDWKEVISFPHPIWEVTGLDAPEKIAKDTNFNISVLVKNIGNDVGDKTIAFYLGTTLLSSVTKTLIPNQQETFSISTSIDTVGEYTINVESLSKSIEVGIASFSYSNLIVEPAEPNEEEEFTIKIDVTNTTLFSGETTVGFEVDTVEVGTDTKMVAASAVETFSTTHTINLLGTYSVEAGGLTTSLEIFEKPDLSFLLDNGVTLDDWEVFTNTSQGATYSITEETGYIHIVYQEDPFYYGAHAALYYKAANLPIVLESNWTTLVIEYNINGADPNTLVHGITAEFKVDSSTVTVDVPLENTASGVQTATITIPTGATELTNIRVDSMAFFWGLEVQLKLYNIYFEE